MNIITCKIFGYRGFPNPAQLLEASMNEVGIALTEEYPDFIYHMTGGYQDAEDFISKRSKEPKRIYSLLDVDPSKSLSWYENNKIIEHLNKADVICAISHVVKRQMQGVLKITKPIEVVSFPIRPVLKEEGLHKGIDFLYVGRVYSANKRFNLIKETLSLMKVDPNTLIVVGNEQPPFGHYVGTVEDKALNILYNSAIFTFLPSSFEGLGLTCIEAVIGGSFPILCTDNPMVKELGLEDFAARPNPRSLAILVNNIHGNRQHFSEILDSKRDEFINRFSASNIAKRIKELYLSL